MYQDFYVLLTLSDLLDLKDPKPLFHLLNLLNRQQQLLQQSVSIKRMKQPQ